MLKNKKGFTLVELLAVIVILAIILAIAIPSITNITTKAKTDSFASTVKMMIKGVQYELLQDSSLDAAGLTTAGPGPAGSSTAQISTFTVTDVSPDVTLDATGASGGKFSGCTVTGATLSNITTTGTAGSPGVISGC